MRIYKTFVSCHSEDDPAFVPLTQAQIDAGYRPIKMKVSDRFDPPTATAKVKFIEWLSDGGGLVVHWLDAEESVDNDDA